MLNISYFKKNSKMNCVRFEKIIGFRDQKESLFFRKNNNLKFSSDKYTTVKMGLKFANQNSTGAFKIDSWCVDAIERQHLSKETSNGEKKNSHTTAVLFFKSENRIFVFDPLESNVSIFFYQM